MICTECGRIESLEALNPDMAYGLKVGIRRAQAALYGLDENGDPKLPKDKEKEPVNQELSDYLNYAPREGVSPREKKELEKGLDALKTEEAKPFVPVEEYPPIHAHTAQFGSELWCKECNPVCADKHGPTKLQWCGHPDCPMNPERFRKKALVKGACKVLNGNYRDEEREDDIRRSKRKSIRNQCKYKSRGKEKRREP